MMMHFTFQPAGRAFGKVTRHHMIDRYEAAIRLEKARQLARELVRSGFTLTLVEQTEIHDAEQAYDAATAALR